MAFRLGSWLVQPDLNSISCNGTCVQLEPKVMSVLVCLAEHPGEVVSKEKVLKAVWAETFVAEGVLTRSIFELRRVFEDEAKEPKVIQTIPKRGYRLLLPVVPVNGHEKLQEQTDEPKPETRSKRIGIVRGVGLAAVLLVTIAAVRIYPGLSARFSGRGRASPIRSIAVLPLRNLSTDQHRDYFADAMTEELITELSRISTLNVISKATVMGYDDSKQSLPEIARELHVDGVVTGSVMRDGDRVRVTTQLTDATSGTNLWAHSYDRDLRDVLTLQSQLAQAISGEIQVQLRPEESARLTRARPVNRKALDAYLAGREHLAKGSRLEFRYGKEQEYAREIQNAVESFQQAVNEDPSYVPAYLAMFEVVNSQGIVAHGNLVPEAKNGVKKALELDDSLAQAHLDMAILLMQWDYDYVSAGKEYQRALELAPKSADVHSAYSNYLLTFGRDEEAAKELELAQSLDPTHDREMDLFPSDWTLDQGRKYLDEGTSRVNILEGADDPFMRAALGKGYQTVGRYKDAVEQYIKAADLYGYHEHAGIMQRDYAKGDYRGAVRDWLREWEKLSSKQYVPSFWPAFLYAGLGDKEDAFRWLEKAYKAHSWCMLFLNQNGIWDPIRSDPRFARYVKLAGLPEDHGQLKKQQDLFK
jgi:TolB-like protein/DNA-binding winged helix-turn-helix (wHTH) protein